MMMAHLVYTICYIYTQYLCHYASCALSLLDPRPATLTHAEQVLQNVSIKLTNGISQAILKEQALNKAMQLQLRFSLSIKSSFFNNFSYSYSLYNEKTNLI